MGFPIRCLVLRVVRLLSVRPLLTSPLRVALTVLGVALGVALWLAIGVINRSTLAFFRESVEAIAGNSKLTIAGDETGFSETIAEDVSHIPGVKLAAPRIQTRATFTDKARGTTQSVVIMGIDLLKEQQVRSYRANDEQVIEDPLEFLNQADSIILTHAFAVEHGLAQDKPFELVTALGNRTFTVRGLLSPSGTAKAFGGGIAIMDIDGAQVMFGKENKVDRVDIVPATGVDVAELAKRIQARLPPGVRVEEPETQANAFERLVQGYQGILSFLGSLAMLVGLFFVSNSISMAVHQRHRELGIVRALGATRGLLVLVFVGEAAVLGAVGGLIGVGFGGWLATALVGSVSRSMTTQFLIPIDVGQVAVGAEAALRSVILGIVVAVVAAGVPAYRATRIDGLSALRAKETVEEPRSRGMAGRILGLLMIASLPLAPVLRGSKGAAWAEGWLSLSAIVGTALLAPWLGELMIGLLHRLLKRSPGSLAVLRLAVGNLLRYPRRTANNVRALALGLVLVIVISTVHATFRFALDGWLERTLHADLLLSTSGRLVSLQVQPVHESMGEDLSAIEGVMPRDVHGVGAFRYVQVGYAGRWVGLRSFDEPPTSVGPRLFGAVVDVTPDTAFNALFRRQTPHVLVSDTFAAHFGKKTGDGIDLDTPSGPMTFIIDGLVVDFGSSEGVIVMARDVYKRVWKDPLVTAFTVQVAPGKDVVALRRRIEQRFAADGLIVTSNAELRADLGKTLDETFAYTRAIEGAALLIGLLGLVTTAFAGVLERVRELGMLRAIGMDRRQLVGMVMLESLVQGLVGAVVAAVLGLVLAHQWVVGTLSHLLGWILPFHFPATAVTACLLAGIGVGFAAGVAAAVRVARMTIQDALDEQ